jgi:DnaJ-class molecular chaperone
MDVFNSPLRLTVPPGIEHGSIVEENITLGSKKGKLILKVQIIIPKNPNNEEKGLYKHLLKLQKGFL